MKKKIAVAAALAVWINLPAHALQPATVPVENVTTPAPTAVAAPAPAASAPAASAPAASAPEAPETTGPKFAYGLLMKQGEKLVFAPCRDRSYALMEDISPNAAITTALNGIGLEAGKKLYVELLAVIDGVILKASSLNFARAEGRCFLPGRREEAWQAVGSGWALAAGGEAVLLKRPGRPDVTVPYQPFKTEDATATFEATQGADQLALRFEQGVCREPAGDALLGWKATLTVNGEVMKGCAWQR